MGSLSKAIASIDHGSTVFLGGFIINSNPWALSLEMVRQELRDLTTIGYAMMSIDVLVGAGCVDTMIGSVNSFEPKFGQPPNVIRALADDELEIEAESGNVSASRLMAGANGIPFVPTRSLVGSDMLPDLEDAGVVTMCEDPFSGDQVTLVKAMNPDYAIIHATRADPDGNVQFNAPSAFMEEAVYAADAVIASVEEIVTQETIRRTPEATLVPSHKVEHLVEAPLGAFPTSLYKYYDHDEDHIETYTELSQTEDGYEEYLDTFVRGRDHVDFLDAVGVESLLDIRADPYYGY